MAAQNKNQKLADKTKQVAEELTRNGEWAGDLLHQATSKIVEKDFDEAARLAATSLGECRERESMMLIFPILIEVLSKP